MSSDYDLKKRNIRELDVYIGSKIRFRRSMMNISQNKLGSSLGVTFQQVQKYEKGINKVSASTLYMIANALGVEISYFMDGFNDNRMLRDETVCLYDTDISRNKESISLLKEYYKVDKPIRKKILDFIKCVRTTT
jgi:transcriptional regulator with XRE-family HTH domain